MNIHRQNIELIFFEYIEGNLSSEEIKELFLFLDKNPDLKIQFDLYINIKLIPNTSIHFDKKDTLKKNFENEIDSFELLCIRFIENDLNANEKLILLNQISNNPEKQKIFEAYQQTILHTVNKIKYSDKESLKKDYSLFEEKCVVYIEGLLNKTQEIIFLSEINENSNKKAVFNLYQKTKLKPDQMIAYTNKEKLKKATSYNLYSLRWVITAAASVLIILYITFSFNHSNYKHIISPQIAEINHLNPLNNRIIKKNNIKRIKNFAITPKNHSNYFEKTEQKNQNIFVQEKTNIKDSIVNIENTSIIIDQIQFAQTNNSIENDSIANEVLSKLFAQNKFNYFHRMVEDISNEKQTYQPNHKGSWWNLIENSTNFIRELANTKVALKEYKYEDNQRVKQEFTLGSFSFSLSVSKK